MDMGREERAGGGGGKRNSVSTSLALGEKEGKGEKASGTKTDPSFIYSLLYLSAGEEENGTEKGKERGMDPKDAKG